jgi:signal transduction histidine kinase
MKGLSSMLEVVDSPLTRFVQEAERRRLARELHDGVVQSLTALVADLEHFRSRRLTQTDGISQEMAVKLETWQALARESLSSMRQALGALRQTVSRAHDLPGALQELLQGMSEAGYCVICECEELPSSLPPDYVLHLYTIAREALINIRKHAQATTVTCFLFVDEGTLYLSIGDDGVGMQLPSAEAQRAGYQQGLIGMRERVLLLGGHLSIESNAGRGTRIDIEVPLGEMNL